MHEASVTEAIIKIVEAKARELGAARVLGVSLVVGEMTGYMGDSIQFYFDRYAKGSALEGAILETRYVKALAKCAACGAEQERRRFSFECATCGGPLGPTDTGTEFYVESIEIER
jgi:hydrogenase nickel incorporation protein HypA/HybF